MAVKLKEQEVFFIMTAKMKIFLYAFIIQLLKQFHLIQIICLLQIFFVNQDILTYSTVKAILKRNSLDKYKVLLLLHAHL